MSERTAITPKKVKRLQQDAKKLKKEKGYEHHKALEEVARENGFPNWKAILKEAKKSARLSEPTPQPSLNFIHDDDVEISEADIEIIKKERTDELESGDKLLLAENKQLLVSKGVEHSIFEPTLTGLGKSILDATQPVRTHFELEGFHDYESQEKGPEGKVITEAFLVKPEGMQSSRMSIYRPKTKDGDPRMWFGGLGGFAPAGSQVAIIIIEGIAYLLNLTVSNLKQSCENNDCIGQLLERYVHPENSVSDELLEKLKKLALKPIPALGKGDTAIGMAIENALGIEPNSSKQPDYYGIELKAGRGAKTRKTLFAQVADWSLSTCKSSREILEGYGYERGEDFKLYCTISTQRHNSQGLFFDYDSKRDELHEKHSSGANVAVWKGSILRDRLEEKHKETFWIQADSEMIDGVEHFHLKSVVHTRSPLLNQLMPLIENGVITMDHLIKKKGGAKPRVSEKGPLFKMDKKNLSLLFPAPVKYPLI